MAFIGYTSEMDQKVSQIYTTMLIFGDSNTAVNQICQKGSNVNWKIPAQTLRIFTGFDFDGTLLHVAHAKNQIGCFKVLLDHGADFIIKNENGSSILHHIFENLKKNQEDSWVHLDDPFINMILSAHVQFGNSQNPCDKNGLSHLHVACMANHLEAVKLFLNNGALVDQHMNMDSSVNPGFTSLHFAAEFNSFESAQFLLSSGANVHLKNANRMTPLHLLVNKRLKIIDTRRSVEEKESIDTIDKKIELNEKLINLILENDTSCCDDKDNLGLSNFHIACLLKDSLVAGCLSDQVYDVDVAIKLDSPIYPGYTGLHFAAHFNVDIVMILLEKGGNMMVKDLEDITPLDICMRWFSLQNIHSIITSVPTWKEILFSDGKTKLADCILAMETPVRLKEFLQNCVDVTISLSNHSVLWPGSTILHLAVMFSERSKIEDTTKVGELVKVCLDQGADMHAQDKHGSTPLHLAFRQNKQQVTDYLLQIHVNASNVGLMNLSDEDGLSYLHISSAYNAAAIFTINILSVNRGIESVLRTVYKGKPLCKVRPGWTPLQVATHCNNSHVLDWLAFFCGDFLKTDSQGFTLIHRLLGQSGRDISNVHILLDSKELKECVVEGIGLTHLHVASWFNNADAVKKLLAKGSDIEAVIRQPIEDESLAKFAGCRPLHVAVMGNSKEAITELLQLGADIFAKKSDLTSPLCQALTGSDDDIANMFANVLWKNDKLQKLMEKQLGLTMLHIACDLYDVKRVKSLLDQGVDVNARVRGDSIIWPGCTSFHLLMAKANRIDGELLVPIYDILDLLLENGADLFAMDALQSTPLQLIFEQYCYWQERTFGDLVLKHQSDFGINPMDNKGLSCFHLACLLKNVDAVEKFLQQCRIDVNQPINFFATPLIYSGCTALHFAITDYHSNNTDGTWRIVELLLNRGAKVTSENSSGNTPLHFLLKYPFNGRYNVMKKILGFCNEANLNVPNIFGQTLMEILLTSRAEVDEIQLLVDHGGRINDCNRVNGRGLIAVVYSGEYYINDDRVAISQIIVKSRDTSTIDDIGRSAIHNAVSSNTSQYSRVSKDDYLTLITELICLGCNVDHQDSFGKTALHLAVELGNFAAVRALLMAGADFNIVDLSHKSAFSYAFEPGMYDGFIGDKSTLDYKKQKLIIIFNVHIEKLKILRIEVSKCNISLARETLKLLRLSESFNRNTFTDQVEITANVKIGQTYLTLRSFLCETGAISAYPSMTPERRDEIAAFFEIDFRKFSELKYILKLQYRKAVDRLSLVAPAGDALNALLSIPLPSLCLEIVILYLSNLDLKNLIDAASIDEEDISIAVNP